MGSSLAALRRKRVVVLPDTFIDAIAHLPTWTQMRPRMEALLSRGGGNIPIDPVEFKLGGNAANLAVALARLGAKATLVTRTNELGFHFIRKAADEDGLGTKGVHVGDSTAATLALEMSGANVMLSHSGPVYRFGPNQLTKGDWHLIDEADAVAVVNWAQNRAGTSLLEAVARRAKKNGSFVFVDTADPRHRPAKDARALLRSRLWKNVDAWGLNENEALAFTSDTSTSPLAAAKRLHEETGTRIDLHTRGWAASVGRGGVARVKAYGSKARRLTGAGDAWNAGNIAGELLGWNAAERLGFAHLVATKYVTGPGKPPTPKDLRP